MRADTKDRELLFIRHCESYGNLDFAENAPVYHPDDPPLTPLGLRQARALSSRFEKGDLDRVYCSSLIRTVQTVYPTAEKLGMSFDLLPQLMEYGTGLDMTDRDRLREHYPDTVRNETGRARRGRHARLDNGLFHKVSARHNSAGAVPLDIRQLRRHGYHTKSRRVGRKAAPRVRERPGSSFRTQRTRNVSGLPFAFRVLILANLSETGS